MEELVWKLPLLRRLSGIWRGVVIAGFLTALVSASLIPISPSLPSGSSSTLFDTLAEIGATLLIAYAVEQAALIRALGIRDLPREEFTGFAVAVGLSRSWSPSCPCGVMSRSAPATSTRTSRHNAGRPSRRLRRLGPPVNLASPAFPGL